MKACPHCGDTYQDFIEFCFQDGEVLVAAAAGLGLPGTAAGSTSAGPSAASLAATPIPRPRRQGESPHPGGPGAGVGGVPEANREGDGPPDDEDAPLPPSAIDTAPIPRPQRLHGEGVRLANAPTIPPELASPSVDPANGGLIGGGLVSGAPADGARPGAAPPPAAQGARAQLLNTTPKPAAVAGEVVEPESSTILVAGVSALVGGAALILLGAGGMFWFSGMFGTSEVPLADAGAAVVEPVPVASPAPAASPVAPSEVDAAALDPAAVEPVPDAPVEAAPAPVEPAPANVAPQVAPKISPAPTAAPEPGRTPPPAPAAPAVQRLRFVSTPSGVEVDVAGSIQKTPFELELGPGSHRWFAQAKNRKSKESVVEVASPSKETQVVDVSLAAETRECLLMGDNNVADIRIEGRVIEALTTDVLPVGVHPVKVTLASGDAASGTIEVPPPSSGQCRVSVSLNQVEVKVP